MNTDDFEKRLQRQPFRNAPREWRAEILSAARAQSSASNLQGSSWFSILIRQLSLVLSPQPKAWAGLAAVWVVIFMLNLASRDSRTVTVAHRTTPPSPETLQVLKQQEQLLAELIERPEPRTADRPKAAPPRPHSRRLDEMQAV